MIIWSLSDTTDNIFSNDPTTLVFYNKNEALTSFPADIFERSGEFFAGGTDFEKYTGTYPNGSPHGVTLNDAYKLAPGSKAIGFGNPGQATAADLLGVPRDDQPDAGAYEYAVTDIKNEYPIPDAQRPITNERQMQGTYDLSGKYLGNVGNSLGAGVCLVKQDGVLKKVVVTPNKQCLLWSAPDSVATPNVVIARVEKAYGQTRSNL